MKTKSFCSEKLFLSVVIFFVTASTVSAGGRTCIPNAPGTSGTHQTCVEWTQGPPPQIVTDFLVDYGCPGCNETPKVELITGDADWKVWAQIMTFGFPLNIPEDIGELTAENGADFGVTLDNPDTAPADGARDVGLINLDPMGNHFSSLGDGSKITHDLTGNLTVKSFGSSGGTVDLIIASDLTGNVSADTIIDLQVGGALTGDVTADEVTSLDVTGNLTGNVIVAGGTIASLVVGPLTGNVTATTIGNMVVNGNYSGSTGITASAITLLDVNGSFTGNVNVAGGTITDMDVWSALTGDVTADTLTHLRAVGEI